MLPIVHPILKLNAFRDMDTDPIREAIQTAVQFDVRPLDALYRELLESDELDTIRFFQSQAIMPAKTTLVQYSDSVVKNKSPRSLVTKQSPNGTRQLSAAVVEHHVEARTAVVGEVIYNSDQNHWFLLGLARADVPMFSAKLPPAGPDWLLANKPPHYDFMSDAAYEDFQRALVDEVLFTLGGLAIPGAFTRVDEVAPRADRKRALQSGVPKELAESKHTTVYIGRVRSGGSKGGKGTGTGTGTKRRLHWVRAYRKWSPPRKDYITVDGFWRGDASLGITTSGYVVKGKQAVTPGLPRPGTHMKSDLGEVNA